MIKETDIEKLADFFQKFRPDKLTAHEHYEQWSSITSEQTLISYTKQCFSDAFILIAKEAANEREFYISKLELDLKRWEYEREWETGNANFYLKQSHIDKILIECHSNSSSIDIRISSRECCSICAKHHDKLVTLENILKGKYLPYPNCKRIDHCICQYQIITAK